MNSHHLLCPVCKSAAIQNIIEYDASFCASLFSAGKPSIHDQLKEEILQLWGTDKAGFHSCTACGFQFAWPFIAGTAKFYSLAYAEHESYTGWKWDFAVSLNSVRLLAGGDKDKFFLLEAGAGPGFFVKEVRKYIPAQNILCTEYSEYGRAEIEKMGIPCLAKGMNEIAEAAGGKKFNVVCMFQLLEHLDELDMVFENINRVTETGAHMLITVPNDVHRAFYDRLGDYYDLPPTHISRWNRSSMEAICRRTGWSVEEHRYKPASWLEKYKEFIFNRAAKYPSYGRIDSLPGILRKSIFAGLFLWITGTHPRQIFQLSILPLGVSQWFRLKRIS